MTPPDNFLPAEALEIRSLDTLKVMADPRRMQIVDYLRQHAATVKELAATMQVPPKSLYYHMNLLEKHGLTRVVDTRIVSGILEKRYRATAYLFNFAEMATESGGTLAEQHLEAFTSLFAITRDEVRIALESGLIDPANDAPEQARLNVDWHLLDLTAEAYADLQARWRAMLDEYRTGQAAKSGEQTYRIFLSVYPTYRRGERPEPASPTGIAPDSQPTGGQL